MCLITILQMLCEEILIFQKDQDLEIIMASCSNTENTDLIQVQCCGLIDIKKTN